VVLEVGSGALGLGEFWTGNFFGCDVAFAARPVKNLRAVQCSGHQLPFPDGAFDAVVVSDVMEHVPPAQREQVIAEVLRVARKVAVFGYPCGPAAFKVDQNLYRDYQNRRSPAPAWLQEHMLHPFPDEQLWASLPPGWKSKAIPNESLPFHSWMMRMEMFRLCNHFFRLMLRVVPGLMERWLQRADREPSYRKIFVLTRESEEVRA
jgi:SAM-dependent methyltransferase